MASFINGEFASNPSEPVKNATLPATGSQQSETDHRIANSLQFLVSLLRYESRQVTTVEAARSALTNAAERLSAIARIHRQLSRNLPDEEVYLTQFLQPLCKDISQSFGAILKVKSANVKVRADVAGQICIVLNELAMNAVKHGGCGDEPVILTLNAANHGNSQVRLTLRDNGCGLPEGFSFQASNGLGMLIITSTVEKLRGSIRTLPGEAGEGAGFEIDLPLENPEHIVNTQPQ